MSECQGFGFRISPRANLAFISFQESPINVFNSSLNGLALWDLAKVCWELISCKLKIFCQVLDKGSAVSGIPLSGNTLDCCTFIIAFSTNFRNIFAGFRMIRQEVLLGSWSQVGLGLLNINKYLFRAIVDTFLDLCNNLKRFELYGVLLVRRDPCFDVVNEIINSRVSGSAELDRWSRTNYKGGAVWIIRGCHPQIGENVKRPPPRVSIGGHTNRNQ
jgi:hypothetical protein